MSAGRGETKSLSQTGDPFAPNQGLYQVTAAGISTSP